MTEYDEARLQPPPKPIPPSPLGKDPEPTEPVVAPEPAPAPVAPVPAPAPQRTSDQVSLTQDEYDQLQDDSQSFKTIMGDNKLASLVYDHLRDGSGGQVQPPPEPAQEPVPGTPATDPALLNRLSTLEAQVNEGREALLHSQRELARITLNEFSKENPQFDAVKSKVLNRMREHPTLSLRDATSLVVAEEGASASQNGPQPAPTVMPTVEGKTTGAMPVDHSDPMAGISDKIDKAGSFDEAFGLALAAAKAQHGA